MVDSRNILYAYRGIYKKKHVTVDVDATIKIQMDATNWLDGDNIASAVWKTEDETSLIAVSNTSETTKVCTAYLTTTSYGQSINLKCSALSDNATPETCSRSFTVHRART